VAYFFSVAINGARKLSMKQFGLAVVAGAVFATMSSGVSAQNGQFLVDGGVGRSSYSLRAYPDEFNSGAHNDKTDWATSIRVGYMWHGIVDYGVELGYVDLGQSVARYPFASNEVYGTNRDSAAVNGWLLGGRLEYAFGQSWYVMARGGWFRPRINEEERVWGTYRNLFQYPREPPTSFYNQSQYSFNNGGRSYVGLGFGYVISPHWRVGLTYDRYDLGSFYGFTGDGERNSGSVSMYALSAQFRF
jgi:OOP family OmpA-OmpF porin